MKAAVVLSANDLEDIQKKLGKKLHGLDKLAQLPENERQQTAQAVLKSTKDALKSFYIQGLEGQVKSAIEAGTPKDHPYVQAYANVISKIKGL